MELMNNKLWLLGKVFIHHGYQVSIFDPNKRKLFPEDSLGEMILKFLPDLYTLEIWSTSDESLFDFDNGDNSLIACINSENGSDNGNGRSGVYSFKNDSIVFNLIRHLSDQRQVGYH